MNEHCSTDITTTLSPPFYFSNNSVKN